MSCCHRGVPHYRCDPAGRTASRAVDDRGVRGHLGGGRLRQRCRRLGAGRDRLPTGRRLRLHHCGRRLRLRRRGRVGGLLRCRCRHGTHRQECQRIDVALLVGGLAQPEVHVRLVQLRDAAWTDRADGGAFLDVVAASDRVRAQVDERRRIALRSLDRDGLAARRNRAGEADDADRRREHVRACRRAEVDTPMLAGSVGVRMVERERAHDRTVDGPCPCARRRDGQRKCAERENSDSPEHEASLLPDLRTKRP